MALVVKASGTEWIDPIRSGEKWMDGLCLVIDNIMELSVESCEEYLKVMPNCFSQKGNGSHGEERMATMTKR